MIDAIELYEDFVKDNANSDQNGSVSYAKFNRTSWRAQLRVKDYLTGSIKVENAPTPPANQKNKDFLSQFITEYEGAVSGGMLDKPADYYQWQNGFLMPYPKSKDCDDDEEDSYSDPETPQIELLTPDRFNSRARTYIKEKKPSFSKPIAKLIGKKFHFLPVDIGIVKIEYVRYPVRAIIKTKLDPVYNKLVPDEANTIHFEWDEWARELLLWFITDTYANDTREQALKQFNGASKPTRDE